MQFNNLLCTAHPTQLFITLVLFPINAGCHLEILSVASIKSTLFREV